MSTLTDFCHQWEVIDLRAPPRLVKPYTVRFGNIYRIVFNQHGSSGIGSETTDSPISCNLIDTAGGGSQQRITLLAERPADVVDAVNTLALSLGNGKEAIGGADIDLSAISNNGMHLTCQAVFR